MKSQDDVLLEQAYNQILTKENQDRLYFNYGEGNNPPNVGYSNKTFSVRGKEVLIRSEYDRDEDSEWYYLALVDPETKERVFKDIQEPEIEKLMKTGQYENTTDEYGFSNKMDRDQQLRTRLG